MKIILLQSVKNFGQKGAIKEVADGYARNFLFPKKIAIPATATTIKNIEYTKSAKTNKQDKTVKKISENKHDLESKGIIIKANTNKEGHLFAGIGADIIVKALEEQTNLKIQEKNEGSFRYKCICIGNFLGRQFLFSNNRKMERKKI